MKKLILLLLIAPIVCLGQTDKLDELKKIWIDEMIEFGDIFIQDDIDWTATFVPYGSPSSERRLSSVLIKLGIKSGSYTTKKTAKDANNREMVLSSGRTARGRYWIEMYCDNNSQMDGCGEFTYTIIDSKNDFKNVGTIKYVHTKSFWKYYKAHEKYMKKRGLSRERWMPQRAEIIFKEILKRYSNQ